ncbi:MAG: RnfABCDGE type electron transport complex subunit D [Oscillospiraceae bacterium]
MDQSTMVVSASPHILGTISTRKVMVGVVVALLPTLVASALIFGAGVLLLAGVTVAACVGFEALYCILMKKPVTVGDFSAVVTGLILAFNLPPGFPLWMAMLGAFVAIVVAKQMFGGLGFNFANPALVGRIVLQLSFTGPMIDYRYPAIYSGADALAGATPLLAAQSGNVPIIDLLLGTHAGMLGETCAITLLLGGLFLVCSKIISPIIPVVYVGGVYVFKLALDLAGGQGFGAAASGGLGYILSGGLLLGAIFMATDYVTSPYTRRGKVVFGVLLAILTVAIREWSNTLEGVSYALLLSNLLVPYIDELTRQRPLGAGRKKKSGKGAA